MSELHVIYDPSPGHLTEIKRWLLDECNSTNKEFYCNWDNIESAFKEKQLAVLLKEGMPVGFVVWRCSSEATVVVDIIEMEPTSRRKGYGRIIIRTLLDRFCRVRVSCVRSIVCF